MLYCENGFAYIADGKRRKSDNPKKKSLKHLETLDISLDDNELTDKKLRKALNKIKASLP